MAGDLNDFGHGSGPHALPSKVVVPDVVAAVAAAAEPGVEVAYVGYARDNMVFGLNWSHAEGH